MDANEILPMHSGALRHVARAADRMAQDPIHGGDQWHEFADRLRQLANEMFTPPAAPVLGSEPEVAAGAQNTTG